MVDGKIFMRGMYRLLSRGIDSSLEARHSRGMLRMPKDGACDSFPRRKEDANR